MLWIALHLPLLPLEVFCTTLAAEQAARPVALISDHRVSSVNREAAERGIKPGFKRATALALAGDLITAESEPQREAAALEAVAHAALAFTPSVTLHDARTVLLEVQPSLRLFGGVAGLRQRLRAALAPLRHRVHMAAAPTALGAALLALWFPRDRGDLIEGPHLTERRALHRLLDDVPVWLLGPGREHWEALQGMGLHDLGDLRSLPRSGVARRFSEALLDDLYHAYGEKPDPRTWVTLPPEFDSKLDLFMRAENTEQVLQGAQVLLARLVAWAQARQARVRAFTLRMLHERMRQTLLPPTELHVELAEPSLAPAHLQLLLRERLGRAELAAPTLELQLHCAQIAVVSTPNAELFPTRASETEGLTRLLERLSARLGEAQVQRLLAVPDHRPSKATLTVPVSAVGASAPGTDAAVPEPDANPMSHQPAWLFPEPVPLAERDQMPLLQGHPLRLLSGPERIETGWWDGAFIARDYYVAQAQDGSLAWVYRCRQAEGAGEAGQWLLHGRFA